MQSIRSAAAAFCIACICSELVTQLVGPGWTSRCIKALAGLYILVVLLRVLPGGVPESLMQTPSVAAPAELGSAEQVILAEAETQLETQLAQNCRERFGTPVRVDITLEQSGGEVAAAQVVAVIPADCPEETRTQIAEYLRQQLEVQPVLTEGAADE